MRRKFKVEPLIRTRLDEDARLERALLKMQYFALGIAGTCIMLAFSLPGFWQTALVMTITAIAIGWIRRRYVRWAVVEDAPIAEPRPLPSTIIISPRG